MAFYLKIMFLCISMIGYAQSKEIESITYNAQTTGGAAASMKIYMAPDITIFEKNGVKKSFKTDKDLWRKVNKEVSKLPLAEISNLKSPTNRRAYEGALTATLFVDEGELEYKSSQFDAGNPPSLLKQVVGYLLEVSNKEN